MYIFIVFQFLKFLLKMSEKMERTKEKTRIRVKNYREKRRKLNSHDQLPNPIPDPVSDLEKNILEDFNNISKTTCTAAFMEMPYEEDVRKRSSLYDIFNDSSSENSDASGGDLTDDECANVAIKMTLLMTDLRRWALKSKISDLSLDLLLQILKPYHPELPLSAKTLLKQESKLCTLIQKFNPENPADNSEYIYLGITKQLQKIINVPLHKEKIFKLQFNMDGIPIFKSSSMEFWPILGHIFTAGLGFYYEPFVVAIHAGTSKPKSLQKYLSDFIEELNNLLINGIVIGGQKFAIQLQCFICDRPARSFIKGIIGHGGYYACERCCIRGEDCDNRVIYPKMGEKRTNDSFRNQDNPEHHNTTSPLLGIKPPVDMVNVFVLDVMHLVFLGVIKKIVVDYWLGTSVKAVREKMLHLSLRLVNLSNQVPCDFQRTTRSLAEVNRWKATEFRFFLLYCGPFVLKNLLPELLYKHFLLLSISCRILSCDELCKKFADHAQVYLSTFVALMEKVYGKHSLSTNVHSLLHLVEDVKNLDCSLSEITAFRFENKLGMIKKYVKHGKNPLTQVCNRMEEELEVYDTFVKVSEIKVLKSKRINNNTHITRLQFKNSEIRTKIPNNIVLLKNKKIIAIERIESLVTTPSEKDIRFYGKMYNIIEPALSYPTDSTILDMYRVESPKKEQEKESKVEFSVSDVDCKMVLLRIFEHPKDPQECYAIPLLHNF